MHGVVKDGYLKIKGCCVGPQKRVVTLGRSMLNQASIVALEGGSNSSLLAPRPSLACMVTSRQRKRSKSFMGSSRRRVCVRESFCCLQGLNFRIGREYLGNTIIYWLKFCIRNIVMILFKSKNRPFECSVYCLIFPSLNFIDPYTKFFLNNQRFNTQLSPWLVSIEITCSLQ